MSYSTYSSHTFEQLGIPPPANDFVRVDVEFSSNDSLSDDDFPDIDFEKLGTETPTQIIKKPKRKMMLNHVFDEISNGGNSRTSTSAITPAPVLKKIKPKTELRKHLVNDNEYDEKFALAWPNALCKFQKLLTLNDNVKKELVLILFGDQTSNSALYIGLKVIFEEIFTRTREDLVYEKYKSIFLSDLIDLAAITMKPADLTLPEVEVFIKHFLKPLYESLNYECFSSIAVKESTVQTTSENESNEVLYFISGYVINKLLKPSKSKASHKIGELLRESNPEKVDKDLRGWTDRQTRSGLKYATLAAFNFFKAIYAHIAKHYNDMFIIHRREKTKESIKFDENLKSEWKGFWMLAGLTPEEAETIFQCIVLTFINTTGNGHTNKLRNNVKWNKRKKGLNSKKTSKENTKNKIEKELKMQLSYKHKILIK